MCVCACACACGAGLPRRRNERLVRGLPRHTHTRTRSKHKTHASRTGAAAAWLESHKPTAAQPVRLKLRRAEEGAWRKPTTTSTSTSSDQRRHEHEHDHNRTSASPPGQGGAAEGSRAFGAMYAKNGLPCCAATCAAQRRWQAVGRGRPEGRQAGQRGARRALICVDRRTPRDHCVAGATRRARSRCSVAFGCIVAHRRCVRSRIVGCAVGGGLFLADPRQRHVADHRRRVILRRPLKAEDQRRVADWDRLIPLQRRLLRSWRDGCKRSESVASFAIAPPLRHTSHSEASPGADDGRG